MKQMIEEFPYQDFRELPFDPTKYGLTDDSWHNNACPSFSILGDGFPLETLWVEFVEPAQRETGCKRYFYCTYDPKGEHSEPLETLLETDDAAECEAFLAARQAARAS